MTLHQFTINPSNDLALPAGSNAQVVYSLTDSAEGHFSIEATTGVIRLEKPLRVRPQAALLLTVRASDLGTPTPLSTLGTVTVSVVGLEDYLPVFLNTEHSVQVPEDTPLGTEVLQLATLTRPGAEKTGYRMVSGNEQRRFRLDARTGERASPEAAPGHMRMRGLAGLLDSSRTAFLPPRSPQWPSSFGPFFTLHLAQYQVPSAPWGQRMWNHPHFPTPPPRTLGNPLSCHSLRLQVSAQPQLQEAEATHPSWLHG